MSNSTVSLRRITNERKKLIGDSTDSKNSDNTMFSVSWDGDDIYHLNAVIYGPKKSLYEGFTFKLKITMTNDYPKNAPSVKFMTKIEHVNINKDGDICLDILKDKWVSTLNIRSILISIVSLLDNPNMEDPFNTDLAKVYKTSKKAYKQQIKDGCKKYASQAS